MNNPYPGTISDGVAGIEVPNDKLDDFFYPDYREPFICPYHNCRTDNGWCWECAAETYGYEDARRIHLGLAKAERRCPHCGAHLENWASDEAFQNDLDNGKHICQKEDN